MKTLIIDSIKKHKIFTDPIRQDILSVYRQLGTPQTVKMISDVLNTPHSKIHYHVKKLLELEALNLVKTDTINGITVKYYALTFEDVNFMPSKTNNYNGLSFSNQLSESIKQKFNAQLNSVLEASSALDLDSEGPNCYGILMFTEVLYLTHEERIEIKTLIEDYLKKHNIKDDNQNYATKTKFFCTLHDEEVYNTSEDK